MAAFVAPAINEEDLDELNRFTAGGRLGSAEQETRILCTLRSVVVNAGVTDWPHVPDDCFCGAVKPHTWQSDGQALRFIANADRAALGAVS